MSKGYIVEKLTGRLLYFGEPSNKQRLVNEGHLVVDASFIYPEGSKVHVWDFAQKAWIVDPALVVVQDQRDILEKLSATDASIIRGIEDILDVLITKSLVAYEDMPLELRDKIDARKILRARLS